MPKMRIKKKPKVKISNIEEAITRLIHSKSFYATVIAGITRRAVPEYICDTLAVVCNPETHLGIELIYSQKFIEDIEDMEFFEFVIEHECVHLILEHIQRYWTDKRMKNIGHDTFNIAADMATNDQIIKHYPGVKDYVEKKFWLPGKMGLATNHSMEIYSLQVDAEKRKKMGNKCPYASGTPMPGGGMPMPLPGGGYGMSNPNSKQGQGQGQGSGQGQHPGQGSGQAQGQGQQQGGQSSGSQSSGQPQTPKPKGTKCPACGGTHDQFQQGMLNPHLWGFKVGQDANGNPILKPVGQKELQGSANKQEMNLPDFLQQCVDSYMKDQGTLPGYVQDMIKEFIKLRKGISWQEVLQAKVASGMPAKRTRSIMRSNRRLWGIPQAHKFPGNTVERSYKVCLIMDTSGSMSQRDLQAAASTLKSLMDYYKNVKVWIVHADTRVVKTQELKDISEFDFNVYGRGGTDFVQPIEQVEEEIEPDIILYFTDGYGNAPQTSPKASIVWFISKGGMDPTAHMGTPYGEVVYVEYD